MALSVGDWMVAKREAEKSGLKLGNTFDKGFSSALESWMDAAGAVTAHRDGVKDKRAKHDDTHTDVLNTLRSYMGKLQKLAVTTPEQQAAKEKTLAAMKALRGGCSADDWSKVKGAAVKAGLKVEKLFNEDLSIKIIKSALASRAYGAAIEEQKERSKKFVEKAKVVERVCKDYLTKVDALAATSPAQVAAKKKLSNLLVEYARMARTGDPW